MTSPSSQAAPNDAPVRLAYARARKILFASAHSLVDFSNGASVATLDVLQGLAISGFDAQAFCTPKLDLPHEACFEQIIRDLREPYQVRASAVGAHRAGILYTRPRDVPITVVRLDSTRHVRPRPEEVQAVLAFFRVFLDVLEPDVLLTYGGDPATVGMIDLARGRGIPVVFAIHNLNYQNAPPIDRVDYRIVPSEFARRHYREKIGLECQVLPNPVDWERVWVGGPENLAGVPPSGGIGAGSTDRLTAGFPPLIPPVFAGVPPSGGMGMGSTDRLKAGLQPKNLPFHAGVPSSGGTRTDSTDRLKAGLQPGEPQVSRRRYVTFVNPVVEKGVGPFVRIAQEIGRRRPDIPFLVVESRGNRRNLAALGLGRDAPVQVQLMPHTTDPRTFYALTRIALLPSLCPENQPLVAIEAMINGIPVIGSDRGGIPEVLGESGIALPLPERLTPASPIVPEAEEVEPWIEAIVRLWDDRELYDAQSRRAREEARRWQPDLVRPRYAEFFAAVRSRVSAVASSPRYRI